MTEMRPARPEEARLLSDLALRSKGHWGYDAAFLELARPALTLHAEDIREHHVIVAERRTAITGFAMVDLTLQPPELAALFVDPPAIGHGVGAALFGEAIKVARSAGVTRLLIESDPNAEPFYRSRGATPVGRRRSPSTGRELPLLSIKV